MKKFTNLIYLTAIFIVLSGCASEKPIYRGEAQDGKAHGNGWKVWPGGERYEGEWSNGNMSGNGTFTWPDGGRYEGNFSNSRREGQGEMTYANGEGRYKGQWRNGVRSGRGVMFFANNDRYDGNWDNDAQNGTGDQELDNGNLFLGNFVAGKREGDGAGLAYYYGPKTKWCIEECVNSSPQFAIVAGTFSTTSEKQSVTVTPCGIDRSKCKKMVAPALAALEQERVHRLAEAEREKARLAAEEEREKTRIAAAEVAEQKRIAAARQALLDSGTASQVYVYADKLETLRDYVQAAEVYSIVVARFPDSNYAAQSMGRLAAMRDKRDQQEAEEKRAAEAAEIRRNDAIVRQQEAEARKTEAAANAQAAATQAAAQNGGSIGGKVASSVACMACDRLSWPANTACRLAACN